MIVVMGAGAAQGEIDAVRARLEGVGYAIHLSQGQQRTLMGAVGDVTSAAKQQVMEQISLMPGVAQVVPILKPYKLSAREFHPDRSVIDVAGVPVGGGQLVVMAGPCSVESREQILASARIARDAGAQLLRGGAYKPRTGPYSFQGLGPEGLDLLSEARAETGLRIITEVLDPRHVEGVAAQADVLQIGARNMQNFQLLREVGQARKPVMLKRGLSATIDEWLQAAEYILSEGNRDLMLCERGIRTYETYTRNTFDLSAIPVLRECSHLPIVADPSHGTGYARFVPSMAKAAVAAGADALMIEMHPDPAHALTDGPQALAPAQFTELMKELAGLAGFLGRPLALTA
jgi:3-deoxy-7-phosphoheptulonate synthase